MSKQRSSNNSNAVNRTDQQGINTQLAHVGPDPMDYFGFVNPPVVHASTVLFEDAAAWENRTGRYTYGTMGTPTTEALENALNALEGSAGTIILPSGLASVTVPLLAFANAGDHMLFVDSIYGPTRRFADTMLTRLGIEVEYYDPGAGADIAKLMKSNTSVVFTESPGSNSFEMQDIPAITKAAHAGGAIVMIDNTWATPLFFKPLDHGVDVSIHALTKYPAGHADLVLGSASGTEKTYPVLREAFNQLGACPAPDDTSLVLRGLRTMGIRLERHQKSALEIAKWLDGHDQVAQVLHPGLPGAPGHEIWKRDFCGSSGLFGIVLNGHTREQAMKFLDAMDIFKIGASWGGFESLAVLTNLSDRTIAVQPKAGPVIRLQIGLEDSIDLINDLKQGFAAIY